jgi:hypothetical protein
MLIDFRIYKFCLCNFLCRMKSNNMAVVRDFRLAFSLTVKATKSMKLGMLLVYDDRL